jgi:hypothetical protein
LLFRNFPVKIFDDYEYAKPSLAKSFGYGLQTTEDDADKLKYKRYTYFVKQAENKNATVPALTEKKVEQKPAEKPLA